MHMQTSYIHCGLPCQASVLCLIYAEVKSANSSTFLCSSTTSSTISCSMDLCVDWLYLLPAVSTGCTSPWIGQIVNMTYHCNSEPCCASVFWEVYY